jgi:glycerol uptake facilitator protein
MPEALAAVEIPRTPAPRIDARGQATPAPLPSLRAACVAEALGTFLLVLFGLGAVHAAVFTQAQVGVWQVAIVWGIGVALAIHVTAAVSGAHLNPAMTVAMGLARRFPWRRAPAYMGAQLAGAFLAAVVMHVMFTAEIAIFEAANNIVRGASGSERSAMAYGEYFPNPGLATAAQASSHIGEGGAFVVELLATAVLAFVVLRLTDAKNRAATAAGVPWAIGLLVAGLISFAAPLTQACFNPARDFGPRLFAWLAGWGDVAIPGPRGGFFTVYILAPLSGGVLGALLHNAVARVFLRHER